MTQKQAISELGRLGWQFLRKDGKFCCVFNPPVCADYPEGWVRWGWPQVREVIADPKDLLAALQAKSNS